jgi:endonuclease YncB( thermonuclease family)
MPRLSRTARHRQSRTGHGPGFRSATGALERWLPPGRAVTLEADVRPRDRYGRALAWVWAGDTLVNEAMVTAGWAVRYTVPPTVKYVEQLGQAERTARARGRGLWVPGLLTCKPERYRKDR